jgi:hypothetical protein
MQLLSRSAEAVATVCFEADISIPTISAATPGGDM